MEIPTPEQTPQHNEQSGVFPHTEESEIVSFCSLDNVFDWNSVDIVGSPGLTKLIGALTIEECDISALDLDIDMPAVEDISKKDLLDLCKSDSSAEEERNAPTRQPWSARFSVLMKPSHMFEKRTQHILQYELYPFPTSPSPCHASEIFCSGISARPKISDLECRRKLQNLNHLTDAEAIHLVHAMEAKADHLFYLGYWGGAETWFRRVVTAKQKVKWYKPQQTLNACLQVIECVLNQNRYKEAQQIHEDFHVKIERLLGVDHEICLRSRDTMAFLLQRSGFLAEAESVRRQVLQSRLITLGTRHPYTICALHNLAQYLRQQRIQEAAQHLLETAVRFRLEAVKSTGDTERNDLHAIQTVALLADTFNSHGRYDESENLWNCVQKLLGNITRMASSQTFEYHHKRARGYRLQKQFDESEKILRGLFGHHKRSMYPDMKILVMDELARVLMETSRQHEAGAWLKKIYFLRVKAYGPENSYTMLCCARVGNCLSGQRRHNEARRFFEDVLEILASSDDEQMESRVNCVQKVNGWMLKAEKLMEDSLELFSGSDVSEGEWLDTDGDDEDDEDMGDIFDPLRDS
jgi:tetratricopeptide (TPR) repeat protein